MDTIIIVLVFVSWLVMYNQIEKAWKKYNRGNLVLILLVYMVITYLIGYSLTKII